MISKTLYDQQKEETSEQQEANEMNTPTVIAYCHVSIFRKKKWKYKVDKVLV